MHRFKLLLVGLPLAFLVVGWAVVAHAQSFKSGNTVTVRSGQTVDATLFAAGSTIDIAGNINGDVFCTGQNIHVSGRVSGDVVCAGQNVTVTGTVSGDVRLAGQSVSLGGTVRGNATIAAQSFELQSDATVTGDMSVGGQNTVLHGKIGRDLAAGSGTVTIIGAVGRNVQADVGQLNLDNDAKIGGNINYTSQNTLHKSSSATVQGNITKHQPAKSQKHIGMLAWPLLIWLYLTGVVVSLVLVLLFPRLFEHVARGARGHMGMTFLAGLVASIVVPIILFGLMITVIGMPIALLFGLIWLVIVLLSGPFAAYLLGRLLLRRSSNAILIMLVGALILYVLYELPFIGVLFWLVGTWFGIGAILMQWHHMGSGPRYRVGPLPTVSRSGDIDM